MGMKILSSGSVMKNSKIDVVYIYKQQKNEEELRYSIRSVEKNFPHRKIWIVGDKRPRWANENLNFIECKNLPVRYRDVNNKLLKAVSCPEVSEEFFFFNDDFFILNPVQSWRIGAEFDGLMEDKVALMSIRNGVDKEYLKGLKECDEILRENSTYARNFELHRPIRFEKKKLKKLLEKFPETPCRRSLYAEIFGYEKSKYIRMRKDYKLYGLSERVDIMKDMVSTSDLAFAGQAGRIIRGMFKMRSKYERN